MHSVRSPFIVAIENRLHPVARQPSLYLLLPRHSSVLSGFCATKLMIPVHSMMIVHI